MTRALRRFSTPLIAIALIAAALTALDLTPAFAQGGYGGYSSGGGYMSGSGSGYMSGSAGQSYGSSTGSGYSGAPSYQVPSAGYGRAMPRRSVVTVYVVRRGDTLAGIARRFGVSIQALLRANPAIMDINRIFVGQTLIIASRAVVFSGDADRDADDMVSGGSGAYAPPTGVMPPMTAPYGNQQPPSQEYQPPASMMPTMPYGSQQPTTSQSPAAPQPMMPPTAPPASNPQAVTINLAAHNLMFDVSTITVPAGVSVMVNFDNQDAGVPHNFAVYTDSSAQQAIFRGQIVTGPAKMTYTFTAPSQPGTYFFRCDVHFTMMTGQFVVR